METMQRDYQMQQHQLHKQQQVSQAQYQRERNREAVRKCRQRKKEMEQVLMTRAAQLEVENAKLRSRLELGTTEAKDAKDSHAEQLISTMKGILKQLHELDLKSMNSMSASASATASELESKLQQVVDDYVQRHEDHGRDKQTSLGFIMGRLHANAKSSSLSRIYLSLIGNHQDDQFYAPNVKSPWNDFVNALQLTDDQQTKLKRRRLQAGRVIAELRYAERRIDAMHRMIRSIKSSADAMMTLPSVISTRQFAKFIVWVNTEPGCKDILDLLFQIMIRQFDDEISKERKMIQESDTSAQEVDRLLFEVRSASGNTVKRLFETLREDEMQELVRCHFHPNITVVDPTNGGEWCGHQGLIKYVRMVQKSFSVGEDNGATRNFALIDKSITIDGPTVRGTFELVGTYTGRLSNAVGKVPSPKIGADGKPEPTKKVISCEVVVSISFAEASDRIVELVISMDTLSFMTQLGLIIGVNPVLTALSDPGGPGNVSASTVIPSKVLQSLKRKRDVMESDNEPKSGRSSPRPNNESNSFSLSFLDMPQLIMMDSNLSEYKALRSRCHARIKDMFEADDQQMLKDTAEKVLHPNCIFSDSNLAEKSVGIEECIQYVNRIKRAFSKIRVVKSTMTDQGASSSSASSTNPITASARAASEIANQLSGNGDEANGSEVLGDGNRSSEDQILAVKWTIDSIYAGSLLPEPKPCTLNADLFIEFDYLFPSESRQHDANGSNAGNNVNANAAQESGGFSANAPIDTRRELRISKVQFSWDASSVMAQLESM